MLWPRTKPLMVASISRTSARTVSRRAGGIHLSMAAIILSQS